MILINYGVVNCIVLCDETCDEMRGKAVILDGNVAPEHQQEPHGPIWEADFPPSRVTMHQNCRKAQ